jgi:hypothetical protein
MPSYRVSLTIGMLRPGVSPASVLPAAAAAAKQLTTVEASDVAVVSGAARITVRFLAEDDELARQIADHVAADTSTRAEVTARVLTTGVGNRWYRVR